MKQTESFFSKINIHIIQCDAEIQEHIKITSQEEFDSYLKNMHIHGLGGTDFRPVFSLVDRLIVSKYSEKYPTLAFDDSRKVAIVKLGYTWTALSSTTSSLVSVSDYDGTGVSRSEARIFHDAYNITKDEVKDLLDMMDEARFHMIMTQNV